MKAKKAEEWLSRYLDGDLSPTETEELQRFLETSL